VKAILIPYLKGKLKVDSILSRPLLKKGYIFSTEMKINTKDGLAVKYDHKIKKALGKIAIAPFDLKILLVTTTRIFPSLEFLR
jgi:hypothetical protein